MFHRQNLKLSQLLFIFYVFFILSQIVHSFYFFVEKGKDECFHAEFPKQAAVLVSYNLLDEIKLGSMELQIREKDIDTISRVINGTTGQGQFSLRSPSNTFQMCAVLNSADEMTARLELSMSLGHDDAYYQQMAVKERLSHFQVVVAQVAESLQEILSEADYMKEQEVFFHGQSIQMNQESAWWPILQVMILIFTGIFVVNNLKSFFKSKRLV